jgi:hypothetical protein
MTYHVIYITKAYNIPPSLVVDSDETGIHLVPKARECTWESRGSKHIHVLGIKDKKQMTMVVSSSASSLLLPL